MTVEHITPTEARVVVEIDGTVLADTTAARVLDETGLPPRYYIPFDDVRGELLTPTTTSTHCPHKGDARYWSVTIDGIEHRDIVWAYDAPIEASAEIAGLLSFYPDRTTITVDGVGV